MKRKLFLMLFLSILSTAVAQTNIWIGTANTNWNVASNWSAGIVPATTHDVIIPTGKTVLLNVNTAVKSIQVNGNAVFTIANQLTFTNASAIASGATVHWTGSPLNGGGTLTNNGTLLLSGINNKSILGLTTLTNTGTITMSSTGDLYISNGIINNNGTFTIEGNCNVTYSGANTHLFNNSGILNRTVGTGTADILATLNNTGILNVTSGTLNLNDSNTTLTGGTYNVATGSILKWSSTVTCSGILTGLLNGEIDWVGTLSIAAANTTTFNFTGTAGVKWNEGTLNGGGTLLNKSLLTLSSAANKIILGGTTLNNESHMNFTGAGDLYISDGIVNNQATGSIDFRVDQANITYSGSNTHLLNNLGLIKKTLSSGTTTLAIELHNSGTIRVETGIIEINNAATQLNSGIYTTASGCTLKWLSTVNCSGTLTGQIAGRLEWIGNVAVAATAAFNFSGNGVSWMSGILNGGGVLTNNTSLNLETTSNKIISGFTTLNNTATLTIVDEGDLYVNDGILNNPAGGVINMKANNGNFTYSGNNSHILNNAGTISRNTGSGTAEIMLTLKNNGRIEVTSGILNITNAQTTFTGGIYQVDSGKILRLSDTVTCSGLLGGIVNGEINWVGIVKILPDTSASFNLTGSGFVNWSDGMLNGGGTLINNSLLQLNGSTNKTINQLTTFNNQATFNITGDGDLYVNDGIFNNTATGTINMKADAGNLTYSGNTSHILNNLGTINRNTGNGVAHILLTLHNAGTLNVTSGTLNINNAQSSFKGGIYNVTAAKTLQLSATVTCSGILTGTIDGEILWTDTIKIPSIATFDFSGNGMINWSNGVLNGGGTLTSKSLIHMTGNTNKVINGVTTINNEDWIIFQSEGDLYINDGIVNNQANGVIELKTAQAHLNYSGNTSHIINNFGLIKKTTDVGNSEIYPILNNSGMIDIQNGTLGFGSSAGLHNNQTGTITGIGRINLGNNFTNNGIFAPGGSPGKLTVSGDFKSTELARIAVELNGLTQTAQYDFMDILGNAVMNGNVTIDLNFAPALTNQFTIASTSGTITSFGLTPTAIAEYDGHSYTFSVTKVGDKNVVLTVTHINVLALNELVVYKKQILLAPNPASQLIQLRNDSGLTLTNAVISDISGRAIQIIDLKAMSQQVTINLENYAAGQYFLKINSEKGNFVKNFIVR